MSYLSHKRTPVPFGSLLDAFKTPNPDDLACLNRANASSQVVAMNATIDSLARDWRPTGFYRPVDVQKLLAMFADEAEAAGQAVADAPLSTADAQELKAQAFDDMIRKYKDRSRAYEKAFIDAKASGATVIDAPALKDWVLSSLQSIKDAYVTAAVLQCRFTWLEAILTRAQQAIDAVASVAKTIFGVAVQVGESVVRAVDTAGALTAKLIRIAPYAALFIGGYFLYNEFQRNR